MQFENDFERDTYEGLTQHPKHLSSMYFYDAVGDALFQKIMALPEYYLTRTEADILTTYKTEISQLFAKDRSEFTLCELGAGDGSKTKILLRELLQQQAQFSYAPIDISPSALEGLGKVLQSEFPDLSYTPLNNTYFESLEKLKTVGVRKVILFMGSNIGNLLHPQALDFLTRLRESMASNDLLCIGFDLKKHPQKILDAYNDKQGVTEAFNKNILTRINNEMGGNFNLDAFLHWEVYDPETGTAKSYLVSQQEQEVSIPKLDLKVTFAPWETIHTEISQKYDSRTIEWLCEKAELEVVQVFKDPSDQYGNYILKKA